MANLQERSAFITTSSPLVNHQEQEKHTIEDHETTIFRDGCGCFRVFGFKRWRTNNDRDEDNSLLQQKTEPWWAEKVKKAKEVSEIVAGPKWKNFIRKLGGYCNNMKRNNKHRKMNKNTNMFQYSPQSYALNFDDGDDDDGTNYGFAT